MMMTFDALLATHEAVDCLAFFAVKSPFFPFTFSVFIITYFLPSHKWTTIILSATQQCIHSWPNLKKEWFHFNQFKWWKIAPNQPKQRGKERKHQHTHRRTCKLFHEKWNEERRMKNELFREDEEKEKWLTCSHIHTHSDNNMEKCCDINKFKQIECHE